MNDEQAEEKWKEMLGGLNRELERRLEADAKREARIVVGLVIASAAIAGLAVIGLVTVIVDVVRAVTGR
ncbi:MAG TPA: hypothetical protein VN039_12910 [Nitrospira sp.]|nr:hypothetical protein [Nitrospira sp.]